MRLGPLLTGEPMIRVYRRSTVAQAARTMDEHNIGALGVYSRDEKHLLGIVTDRDMTRCIADGLDPATTEVQELMTTRLLVTRRKYVTAREAAKIMKKSSVRHLIVKGKEGDDRMISLRDVV